MKDTFHCSLLKGKATGGRNKCDQTGLVFMFGCDLLSIGCRLKEFDVFVLERTMFFGGQCGGGGEEACFLFFWFVTYAHWTEMVCRSDAAQHQQLRSVDRSSAQDDLTTCAHEIGKFKTVELDGHGPFVFVEQYLGERWSRTRKIRKKEIKNQN